ncbi:MAG: ParB/RepB/Spo0J family partition protein [Pseudomonadota bacterium]
MAAKKDKRGLGRGLSALMADVGVPETEEAHAPSPAETVIPVAQIVPNPDQPRRQFKQSALEELAASIREKGVIQPLILRPDPSDVKRYQIVAGERRWRAAQLAQVHDLPAIVRTLDDVEVLEIAIIENIQRADLNAVEEALGYRQLLDRFGHTQEKLAEALGKSRSHVANTLRLLGLPDEVQKMLAEGRISAGHARALLTVADPIALAREIERRDLSVRETERLAKSAQAGKKRRGAKHTQSEKDADTRALEGDLMAVLRMKVSIDHKGTNGGTVSIRYGSLDQLDRLCQRLSATADVEFD